MRPAAQPREPVERTVEDVVLSRQAISRFADRPVRRELLTKLFSLAPRAPSDWNLQPWRWLVLRGAECDAQQQSVNEFFRDRPDRTREFAVRNSMLALMTLILVAQAEGLASGFVGACDEAGIRRAFRIPDRWAVAMILTLGYPAEEPPSSLRKPLAEVVDWDEFDGRGAA